MKTITLTFFALIVLTASIHAQSDKPTPAPNKNAPDATKTPAINTLSLTESEKTEGGQLGDDLNRKTQQLQLKLAAILTGDVDTITQAALSARVYFTEQVSPAQAKYGDWLQRAQKAHDCVGCELRNGAFVKAK